MTASIGTLGQLGVDTSNPVTSGHRLDYLMEDLVMMEEIIDGNGLRGTRSRSVDRTRKSLQRIAGPIQFQPNAVETDLLLQWVFGVPASNKYSLADAVNSRYVQIDRAGGQGKVFTYAGVAPDTASLHCQQGQALRFDLNCIGQTETIGNAGTFPSVVIDYASGPWIFSDVAMTCGGTTITPKQFEIVINNMIDRDRFFNSLTLSAVNALDREVTFHTVIPYGDFTAIYGSGGSGVAVVATLTNAVTSKVLTITLPKVVFPRRAPQTPGRTEIMLEINGKAYKDSSTSDGEIYVTLA